MKKYVCERCHSEVNDSHKFCEICGSRFDASTVAELEKELKAMKDYLNEMMQHQVDYTAREISSQKADITAMVKKVTQAKNSEKEVADAVEGADTYKVAHGKMPSGHGMWIFAKKKNVDLSNDEEYVDYITVTGDYSAAKSEALKWAKEQGYSTIYVQT
jgi:ElaB/YqjD/DUF883 family membrane-anchored ribosome-binding protein